MYTARQVELGTKVRKLLADKGYVSVAAVASLSVV